jgi:signal transduction histidine kinase/ActR/RegA family two-component response regulator
MSAAAPARGFKALESQFGRLGRAAALLSAGRAMGATLDAGRIGQMAVATIEQALPACGAALLTLEPAGGAWRVAAHGSRGAAFAADPGTVDLAAAPFSADVRRRHIFLRKRLRLGRHGFDAAMLAAGYRGYVALPVVCDGRPDSALCAAWQTTPGPDALWFLEVLSVQTALALRSATLGDRLAAAEHDLARARDRADHASRLQALGQVASGVAHDFNNALTTILGLSDWLLHELASDTPFYADLETIRTAAEDAAAMVRRLQMFSRLRPDSPRREPVEAVDLDAVIRAVADLAKPRCQELALERGRPFDVQTACAGPIWVQGSPCELRELLVNLVFNGLDAMPDGGTLWIATGLDGPRPQVTVSDPGTGMADDVRSRIFEPFFSTKGHKGNGLGLSMCAGIAGRHGADLTVTSEPGAGSCFTLTFPAAAEAPAAVSADAAACPAAGTPLNVLVVDDRLDVRDSLGAMVSALGHAVAKVADGESALDMVIARAFDVVVTDLGLPGMSGAELSRAVAACRPATAVVCITAWDGDRAAEAARAGAVAVSKPVTMEALSRSLRDAHSRRASRAGLRLVHSAETGS